ncbi:MAG: tetratricopeptide repeat protein [Betaproteobacteria bacterium]
MRSTAQTPSLARLSAIILGLSLSLSVSYVFAQATSQPNAQAVPEIQRLIKQGQLPQALDKAETLISSKPREAPGRFMKGLILTEMGRQSDAIAVFTKLTEDFPELPEPYNNLAVLYAQQKQYDRARSALEMAIRTHPSYSIAHENLGDVYAKLASQAYDKALQIDSTNTATQTKLSMIKDLISTSSKPGTKPGAAARPEPEPVKVAAAEASKPSPAKTTEKPAETAASVKPVETKAPEVKAPAEKAAAVASGDPAVSKALQGWASAWSNKDVKSYLSYYASDFQPPNGLTRKAWETERSQRIDKPGKLQVVVDNIAVTISGEKATVKFRQHYTSSTLKTSASKTVVFVKSGGKWLIQQERVG